MMYLAAKSIYVIYLHNEIFFKKSIISRYEYILPINFAEIYIFFFKNHFFLLNSIEEISLKKKNLFFTMTYE